MDLHVNIQEYRKKIGQTQEELAEKCDVSRQAVTKWETGESVPTLDKLMILADTFDVSLDELVGRKRTTSSHERKSEQVNISEIPIIKCVTEEYGVTCEQILEKKRNSEPNVRLARHTAMYLFSTYMCISDMELCNFFHCPDHIAVKHIIENFQKTMHEDEDVKKRTRKIYDKVCRS